eukprot:7366228-Prymnesium_polylepis.1
MVPHAGVVNLLHSARHRPYPSGRIRYGLSINFAFDAFQLCLFVTLGILGGTGILLADSLALCSLDSSEDLTCLTDLPSLVAAAMVPSAVEWVQVGGEALTQSVVDHVGPRVKLFTGYGPTEVSIEATGKMVQGDERPRRLASIGGPHDNVTCFVVDADAPSPTLQPIG